MSREELKSDHRDTKVDAIEERPGWGLKVLVVGEKTLERKALENLRNQGLGVQTTSLDRFEIVSGTYGPDAVVCSERCLRTGLGDQLRQDGCDFSVVVLRHGTEPISSISSKLSCALVVIPPGETPLRIASLVHEAAKRARDGRKPKGPSPRTLPSAARSKDSSPPPSFPPPPLRPSIYPEPDEDEPTKMYAARDFFPEEVTPPSSFRSPSEQSIRDTRDTAVTPSAPPTSMRLPLSSRGQHLNGVRVALVDIDPTRTDAIAVALRARRAEVHIASLNSDRPRFRLLRKFAPHALLIDEEVLANEGLQFLHTFREDPFLQHTQLLTLRFDRLFRVRSGTASIESIKDILEPLGRAEAALLSQLGPSVEVEFDLDQFPPHRLIKMLAHRKAPTTIVCTREKETFRWTVANGRTGRAEVWHAAHPEPCVLPPDEALDWLLSHRNCHVVLVEPTDYDEVTGRSVIPLVENKESGMWELPHLLATQQAPSVRKRIRHGSQPDSLGPVSIRPRPITSRLLFGNQLEGAKSKWVVRLGAASAVMGALLGLLIFRSNGKNTDHDSEAQSAAEQPPHQDAVQAEAPNPPQKVEQKPVEVPAPAAEKQEKTPLDLDAPGTEKHALSDPETLFLVTSAEDIPCEDVVGVWSRPVNARNGLSNMHFRSAQKLLVEGRADQAHVDLCKSALLNPAGPGSELLAQFSLAQRATLQAERWIREVLKKQPESTTARELLGDILHQQGRHDEALQVWFETLEVKPEDMAKRKAVARVWVGHSRVALGAADYPRAERSLRRSLAFDPSNAEAASLLSIVFRRRNNPDQADAWEKEAARLRGAR